MPTELEMLRKERTRLLNEISSCCWMTMSMRPEVVKGLKKELEQVEERLSKLE